VKSLVPDTHFEKCGGDYEDNYIYCSKDNIEYEFGTPVKKG